MSWKEKFHDYRERKEAREYFRSHNNQILSGADYHKVILAGLCAGIAAVFFHYVLNYMILVNIHFISSVLYLIIGWIVAEVMTRLSGIHSNQLARLAAIITAISFLLGTIAFSFFYHQGLAYAFSLLTYDPITLLLIVAAIAVAYSSAS